MTLGDASILSLVDARQLAEKLLRDVALGIDPRHEREQLRKVPTFADFIADQYMPYPTLTCRLIFLPKDPP